MSYNLIPTQEKALEWLVEKTRSGELAENEVLYAYSKDGGSAVQRDRDNVDLPDFITKGIFDVLDDEGFVNVRKTGKGSYHVTLTGRAYDAVDDDFEEGENTDSSIAVLSQEGRLDLLFKIHERTGGNMNTPIDVSDVTDWGYGVEEATSALQYLSDKDWLRVTSRDINGRPSLVYLTSQGIDRAEEHYQNFSGASSQDMDSEVSIDVFISHSSQDSDVAEILIELLESALDLPSDSIRCTSVEGYQLPAGVSTDEALRSEVHGSKLLIGLITPNSMSSPYVLFELGARWGAKKPMFPVLAKGAEHGILGGPLEGLNVLDGNIEGELHQLVEDIADELDLEVGRTSQYRKYISRFVGHGR
jgi:hypothetical protein